MDGGRFGCGDDDELVDCLGCFCGFDFDVVPSGSGVGTCSVFGLVVMPGST